MPRVGRRGFTLVETLVALVLLGVVSLAIYKLLVSNQRVFQAQTQRIDLQQNLRLAPGILSGEFRELDASEGDILSMAANSITIRAMRRLAFICNPPVLGGVLTGRTMTVRNAPFFGSGSFSVGDSLLMFYEADPTLRTDDGWQAAKVTAVQAQNCPAPDNAPGVRLTIDVAAFVAPKVNVAGAITTGSPVRGFEIVTYSAYQHTDSKWYVALQNVNGTQPIIGPIIGSTGLSFTYFDANGVVTAVRANVAGIGITLRAQTGQQVWSGDAGGQLITKVDSIATRVNLRNNPRF
jgi:prepilin-type N-terminal cleavage/methylation domain-containing protein